MTDTNFLRRSQVITTFGPGALVDLPNDSVIIGGLNQWTHRGREEVQEPRLIQKLCQALAVPTLRLFTPPACDENELRRPSGNRPRVSQFIRGRIFPTWFVTQEPAAGGGGRHRRRRLVHWDLLDRKRYPDPEDGIRKRVVPVRFVCACPKGHIDDINWRAFIHQGHGSCTRTLWIEERGTSGDVADVVVGCDCGAERPLYEGLSLEGFALGVCQGRRPWLGQYASEPCTLPNRLLVRTASNAYFAESLSVLSLPDQDDGLAAKIDSLWDVLAEVETDADLAAVKKFAAKARTELEGESDADVLAGIVRKRTGGVPGADVAVKEAEFDILASGKPIIGRDSPSSPFYAITLDRSDWDPNGDPLLAPITRVVMIHRLREVVAQVGFTRFDAPSTDEKGELDLGVERAMLDIDINWLPAVENRGEGIFIQIDRERIEEWMRREAVVARVAELQAGFGEWKAERPGSQRLFPGAAYVMLHSLSHLLLSAIALECGYPASSLRERVFAFDGRFGILIHTGSTDADGTLGGLVEEGRKLALHMERAREAAQLCSNDPVCAGHRADDVNEHRFLHGAACHGCLLIAETSCEQRNDLLDRALVFPTVATQNAAFFPGKP